MTSGYRTRRVVVMGGSVGSDVEVLERSPTPLEGRGVGIVMHPATARYFAEQGLADLDEISAPVRWLRYLDPVGSVAHQEPCRYRFTSWNTLYRQLLGAFGSERYHMGAEVVAFHDNGSRVEAQLVGGATVEGNLLVAADGVASTARSVLLPEAVPRYAGYSAAGTLTPGRRRTNWVWYRNVAQGGDLDALMTDSNGQRQALSLPPGRVQARYVADLRAAAASLPPTLREMVLATAEPFIQGPGASPAGRSSLAGRGVVADRRAAANRALLGWRQRHGPAVTNQMPVSGEDSPMSASSRSASWWAASASFIWRAATAGSSPAPRAAFVRSPGGGWASEGRRGE